jgi:peptidoglycan/LPS O-acetylase OafA/YrhL
LRRAEQQNNCRFAPRITPYHSVILALAIASENGINKKHLVKPVWTQMAKIIFLVLFLLVAGSLSYLALSELPAPTKPVEKPIPAERFFQR